MHRINRLFILLAFIALAGVAIWPHAPFWQDGWNDFREAWRLVRSGAEPAPDPVTPPTAPTTPARNRQVLAPNLAVNEALAPPHSNASDPFLEETRRRAREDPEATLLWLQAQSSGNERLRGMLEVVALWAADDSESTLLWLESNAQGFVRMETLNSGVELWAQRNPREAADWIDGMANDGSKVTAAKALAAKWAEQAPKPAAAWVSTLPAGEIRSEAAAALIDSWGRQDPRAASLWALAESEFRGSNETFQRAIEAYTESSPEAAEAFLRELPPSVTSPAIVTCHLSIRAELDPTGTAQWLAQMPENDPLYSPENANILMQVWAYQDSVAASDWLNQQSPGPHLDAAIAGFSQAIQGLEPEAAVAWAATIQDSTRRSSQVRQYFHRWARADPDAARNWLKQTDFKTALKETLLQELPVE